MSRVETIPGTIHTRLAPMGIKTARESLMISGLLTPHVTSIYGLMSQFISHVVRVWPAPPVIHLHTTFRMLAVARNLV